MAGAFLFSLLFLRSLSEGRSAMRPRLLSYAHALEACVSVNWIINRRTDLLWFIGGALAGYALFFMHAGLGWDMITI